MPSITILDTKFACQNAWQFVYSHCSFHNFRNFWTLWFFFQTEVPGWKLTWNGCLYLVSLCSQILVSHSCFSIMTGTALMSGIISLYLKILMSKQVCRPNLVNPGNSLFFCKTIKVLTETGKMCLKHFYLLNKWNVYWRSSQMFLWEHWISVSKHFALQTILLKKF